MGAPAVAAPKRARTAPRRAKSAAGGKRTATSSAARTSRATPAARPSTPARRARPAKHRNNSNVIRFPVNAVGRTAGAVNDLANSGVVVGMTRGRAWIFVVSVLLGGIVAVNVLGLSLSASGSDTAAKIDDLQRQNSVLRGRNTNRLSNDKVSAVASRLGLAVPAANDVGYLTASRGDVEEAARRLAGGEITVGAPVAADPVIEEAVPIVDPVTGEAVVSTPTTPEVVPETAPVEPAPTVEQAAPAADPAATAGGLDPGAAVP